MVRAGAHNALDLPLAIGRGHARVADAPGRCAADAADRCAAEAPDVGAEGVDEVASATAAPATPSEAIATSTTITRRIATSQSSLNLHRR
jgi:hypothetical protein